MQEVKKERTGWRDLELSKRHRRWGWDCPAVDLDFLFLEYDKGKAVAIIEYKHEYSAIQHSQHPTYQAMIDLGNRAKLPVFGVRYSNDFYSWKGVALNDYAKFHLPKRKCMTEIEWVRFLYALRGYELPKEIEWDLKI